MLFITLSENCRMHSSSQKIKGGNDGMRHQVHENEGFQFTFNSSLMVPTAVAVPIKSPSYPIENPTSCGFG